MEIWWMSYPLVGGVVGVLAGLFGIGGGAVLVPVLTALFLAQGVATGDVVHLALGTSMATIVITSVSSLRSHHRRGAVRWEIWRLITPGILLGTFLGTFIAARMDGTVLALLFAAFMGWVAYGLLRNRPPDPRRALPGRHGIGAVGVGIGGVSSLVAIGGGSLSVPFLAYCNVPMREAIATSAAIGLPIALSGSIGWMANGLGAAPALPYTIGYVNLPAFLVIGAFSAWMAPNGAALAHRLPVPVLRRLFALLLLLLSAKMLHGLFR